MSKSPPSRQSRSSSSNSSANNSPHSAIQQPVHKPADDDLDDFTLSLQFTLHNKPKDIQQLLTRCSNQPALICHKHRHENIDVNLVFLSSYLKRNEILSQFVPIEGFVDMARESLNKLILFQEYTAASMLLSTSPSLVNCPIEASTNNTVLHMLCKRQRPNVSLLQHIVTTHKHTVDVNVRNADGDTPLHLVAKYSTGIEGKRSATLLIKHRANPMIENNKGEIPKIVASNGHVREVLCCAAASKYELPAVDAEYKNKIDNCNSSEFPDMPEVDVEPPALPADAEVDRSRDVDEDDEGKKKRRPIGVPVKLDAEELEKVITRLYEQSMKRKKEWRGKELQKLESTRPRKKLTTDEEACPTWFTEPASCATAGK